MITVSSGGPLLVWLQRQSSPAFQSQLMGLRIYPGGRSRWECAPHADHDGAPQLRGGGVVTQILGLNLSKTSPCVTHADGVAPFKVGERLGRDGLPPYVTARHWWVNHKQTSKQSQGGYLWSPKKNKNGARNISCDNMTRAVPGDVVFSYADGKIGAVGFVIDRVRTSPAPVEFGRAAEQSRTDAGWLLPVRFEVLSRPLKPKDHMKVIAPVLPGKHSPIRANGSDSPGIYLAEIPVVMATVIRDLLEEQLQKIQDEIAVETNDQLTDSAMEEEIWQRTNLGPREKRQADQCADRPGDLPGKRRTYQRRLVG